MARIRSFDVEGLGGRDPFISMQLDPTVTVFWGMNGSGKTSLLRVLHAALDNSTKNLRRVPFESARVVIETDDFEHIERTISKSTLRRRSSKSASRAVHLAFADSDLLAVDEDWHWTTINISSDDLDHTTDAAQAHTYLPLSRVADSRNLSARSRYGLTSEMQLGDEYLDTVFSEQVRSRWQSYNSQALESIRSSQQQGIGQILSVLFGGTAKSSDLPILDDPDDAYRLVTTFIRGQNLPVKINKKRFVDRYNSERDLQQVVSHIQEVLTEVNEALLPQMQLEALIRDLYSGNKMLIFGPRGITVKVGGSSEMPLESLSSGERQLLQILLEVLAAGRGSVLIDEPELSMHVDWQRRLIDSMLLVNPHCQLILATHSPEILAHRSRGRIFEL